MTQSVAPRMLNIENCNGFIKPNPAQKGANVRANGMNRAITKVNEPKRSKNKCVCLSLSLDIQGELD